MQIQVKCKCRASAKTSEGDHLEDVKTSCFIIFFKTKLLSLFFFSLSFSFFISKQFRVGFFSYLNWNCESKGEGLKKGKKYPQKGKKKKKSVGLVRGGVVSG